MKANVRVSGIVFKDRKVAAVRHENGMHGTYYLLPGGVWRKMRQLKNVPLGK